MRDKISIDRVARLHPRIRLEAHNLIEAAEANFPLWIAIRVVQGLRTFAEQDDLYNQPWNGKDDNANGRIDEKAETVTHAKGGQSNHNYGLAIDFALLYDKNRDGKYEVLSWDTVKDEDKDGVSDWTEVVRIFKQAGWVWGGDFKSILDKPHVEKTFGYSPRTLLALKQRNKVDAQGYVII